MTKKEKACIRSQEYYSKNKSLISKKLKDKRIHDKIKDPERYKQIQKEFYLKRKDKDKITNKIRRLKYPDKFKNKHIKYLYGITIDYYKDLLNKQNNLCATCNKKEIAIDNKTKKLRALAVDHDHITGKIRGLLCMNCNNALGRVKDNIFILENMIKYLKIHTN